MIFRKRHCVFIFVLLFFLTPSLRALDVPKRTRTFVTDQAGILSPQARAKLERALENYELKTSNQILVVTFPSLEEESLEDFSIRLAEAWKPGQKGRGNGVIFLIFQKERKMRIEVGYGLEGAIPDALGIQIISQVVQPRFKAGQFDEGIVSGTTAILRAAQGEFQGTGRGQPVRRELTPEEMAALQARGRAVGGFVFILVLIFFIVDFFRYRNYVGDHKAYRGRYSFWEWWFRFAVLFFVLNILFRVLFYSMLFSRGGYYGGRSGFGGFSGGGGGFGGGGASGGW
jgi:uncharacterized protein